ncbi:MAG: hypothetical protein M3Y84_05680 [Acidobacteriota bacterium]|nr:hypothetical protein [Acidobacteriota bacterium]
MPVIHFSSISRNVKPTSISRNLITLFLRAGLVAALLSAGWLIYSQLPHEVTKNPPASSGETILQIILRQPATTLEVREISIELYPVDIVAVRHEYFTERRAGKRFDDFLTERMKGRKPVTARLDQRGQTSVVISPGNWWLHATLSGEENLEWRLPVNIAGHNQTVELTSQNVYTRTKSF